MIDNELIADKTEEVIGKMFETFRPLNPGASEYSIFYNPRKHGSWFIIIFFLNNVKFREALMNGSCFLIHSYLVDEFKKVDELKKVNQFIFFELGKRPVEKEDIDILFDKLIEKTDSYKKDSEKTDIKTCGFCGHDFENHQLMTLNDKIDLTSQGWIICPEENCNCFQTWSVNNSGINE